MFAKVYACISLISITVLLLTVTTPICTSTLFCNYEVKHTSLVTGGDIDMIVYCRHHTIPSPNNSQHAYDMDERHCYYAKLGFTHDDEQYHELSSRLALIWSQNAVKACILWRGPAAYTATIGSTHTDHKEIRCLANICTLCVKRKAVLLNEIIWKESRKNV